MLNIIYNFLKCTKIGYTSIDGEVYSPENKEFSIDNPFNSTVVKAYNTSLNVISHTPSTKTSTNSTNQQVYTDSSNTFTINMLDENPYVLMW